MDRLQFPSYLSKILVDSLQAANARDYFTLFFQTVVFVETIGAGFCDVRWEEKTSSSQFDFKVHHNFGEIFAGAPSEIKYTPGQKWVAEGDTSEDIFFRNIGQKIVIT
jgi:hypothetical protein